MNDESGRFLKTTLAGLTAHAPDYALLCVGADVGITAATRLHALLAARQGVLEAEDVFLSPN